MNAGNHSYWVAPPYAERKLLEAFHRAGFSKVRFSSISARRELPGRPGVTSSTRGHDVLSTESGLVL